MAMLVCWNAIIHSCSNGAEYVKEYTVDGLLKTWPNTDYRNWYLGDWATPEGIDQTGRSPISRPGKQLFRSGLLSDNG